MAGQGISGALLKGFVTSIASILIPVALGGALGAKEIFKLRHVDGMVSYVFWVGLPALVFRRLALSEPAALDLRLLGADALSKLFPFVLLMLWRRFFSKSGRIESFEWVITFFMLSTLPNTVLIGDAVLNPLFGVQIETETTAIIFAQSLYWYNVCIVLFEIREIMLEDEKAKGALPIVDTMDKGTPEKSPLESMHCTEKNVLDSTLSRGDGELPVHVHAPESEDDTQSRCSASTRALSCSSRSFSINSPLDSLAQSFSSAVFKMAPGEDDFRDDKPGGTPSASGRKFFGSARLGSARLGSARLQLDQAQLNSNATDHPSTRTTVVPAKPQADDFIKKQQQQLRDFEKEKALRQLELELGRGFGLDGFKPTDQFEEQECLMSRCSCYAWCAAKAAVVKVSAIRIFRRIFKTPLIYATIFGFTYSFLATKYHWIMPSFVLTTLSFLADGTIGLAMVAIGVMLASSVLASKSLWGVVPCGMKWLLAGFAARYIAAPIFMYVGALALSLKGTVLRYAVVQVLIAQGSIGFALAKQYNCKMTIMLAATMVQMLSFIPVILAYFAFVEAV